MGPNQGSPMRGRLGARSHAQAHPLQVSAGKEREQEEGRKQAGRTGGSGHCRVDTKGKS